jgi:prepilin signal peptidase PulO-like enzyme (type II secretory pathway)
MLATALPQSTATFLGTGCLAFALIWLSLSDLVTREIPDLATFAVASVGVSMAWGDTEVLVANAIVAGSILLTLGVGTELIWRKFGRDVLGLGDIKLIGAGVLVVGASSAWIMIMLASVGGILAALFALSRREQGIPFGPFLAYAIFITFLSFGPRT